MTINAIYPGTFDPITNGHVDICLRASRLFDHITLAVAKSSTKPTLFTIDERTTLAAAATAGIENISVVKFDNLVTEFARSINASVIIRGLRAVSDFEYELQMAGMNRRLYANAETVFLTPAENLSFISSSLVKEIASMGGDVSEFVHQETLKALQNKFNQNH